MEPRIVALTEGHLDRVLVERMLKDHDPDVYPKQGERRRGGKDTAISDTAVDLRAGVARLVLALDINGGDEEALCSKVEAELRRSLGALRRDSARHNVFLFGEGRRPATVCLWAIGSRNEPLLHALGVERHSAEDLIIRALHVPECLASVMRSEESLRMPQGGDPWGVVSEMLKVARARGASVDSSKDVLRIFLALIGFGPTLATVGERVIRAAEGTAAQAIFDRPVGFELP